MRGGADTDIYAARKSIISPRIHNCHSLTMRQDATQQTPQLGMGPVATIFTNHNLEVAVSANIKGANTGNYFGPVLVAHDANRDMRAHARVPSEVYLPTFGILIPDEGAAQTEFCRFEVEQSRNIMPQLIYIQFGTVAVEAEL